MLANYESIHKCFHSEEEFPRSWGLVILFFFCGRGGAYFTVFSILACVALTGRMIGDRWIGSDLEGSNCGLI